jgi:hypothetical protein
MIARHEGERPAATWIARFEALLHRIRVPGT